MKHKNGFKKLTFVGTLFASLLATRASFAQSLSALYYVPLNPISFQIWDSTQPLVIDPNAPFTLLAEPTNFSGTVVFDLDQSCSFLGENPPYCHIAYQSPYDIAGNINGVGSPTPWLPPLGAHDLAITVYSSLGVVGNTYHYSISVQAAGVATPSPTPSPAPTPVPAPNSIYTQFTASADTVKIYVTKQSDGVIPGLSCLSTGSCQLSSLSSAQISIWKNYKASCISTGSCKVSLIDQAEQIISDHFNKDHQPHPDWLLLHAGDVFEGERFQHGAGAGWTIGGRSASEPLRLGSYYDASSISTDRPLLAISKQGLMSSIIHLYASNVAISGLHMYARYRDPTSTYYDFPKKSCTTSIQTKTVQNSSGNVISNIGDTLEACTGMCSSTVDTTTKKYLSNVCIGDFPRGIEVSSNVSNFLIEDSVIESFGDNMDLSGSNISIRYNTVANSFSSSGRSQGTYVLNASNVNFEGNRYIHNGWNEHTDITNGGNFMSQNHNLYVASDNSGVSVQKNIFCQGAGAGSEIRSGGLVQNNLYCGNGFALTFGLTNGASLTPGGVTGEVSGNVVFTDPIRGGTGFELGNIKAGGTNVHDNIFTNPVNNKMSGMFPFSVQVGNATTNPSVGVGTNDLTIQNNIVYKWGRAFMIDAAFVTGGCSDTTNPSCTPFHQLKNLVIQNNSFQNAYDYRMINHLATYNPLFETFTNNSYSTSLADQNQQAKVLLSSGIQQGALSLWVSLAEPNATISTPQSTTAYDQATLENYDTQLGGNGTLDDLIRRWSQQSSAHYDPKLDAPAVLSFVKAAFGKN